MKLTDPQRMFCQLVVDGVSQTEAYKRAYPRCKSRNAAGAAATRMLRKDKVQEEITRLRTKMDHQRCLTRLRKRQILHNIAEDESLPENHRIQAIATDNKMMGHDEPARVQVEVGVNSIGDLLRQIRSGEDELKNVTGSVMKEDLLSLPGS